MKNVTVRDAHGNEIAFYPSLSNNLKLIQAELADKFGPGKYKLCFKAGKKTKSTTDKNGKPIKKVLKEHPTTRLVWVADPSGGAVPLSGNRQASNFNQTGQGQYGSMLVMEKLSEVANTLSGVMSRLDSLETDDDEDEDDDSEGMEDTGGELAKEFGGLISDPKYGKIFAGVLTGNPETIKQTILQSIETEPEVFTELIGKCVTIILTHV